jgi:hypothetical protein
MKVSMTDENGTYSVEIPSQGTEDGFWLAENCLVPLPRAAGYTNDTLKRLFTDEVDV